MISSTNLPAFLWVHHFTHWTFFVKGKKKISCFLSWSCNIKIRLFKAACGKENPSPTLFTDISTHLPSLHQEPGSTQVCLLFFSSQSISSRAHVFGISKELHPAAPLSAKHAPFLRYNKEFYIARSTTNNIQVTLFQHQFKCQTEPAFYCLTPYTTLGEN